MEISGLVKGMIVGIIGLESHQEIAGVENNCGHRPWSYRWHSCDSRQYS